MSNQDLWPALLAVLLLMLGANLLGQLFRRIRQPKVVGEILAGVLLGPSLLGRVAPGFAAHIFGADRSDPTAIVLAFMYNLGLILLMFVSGATVKHVLGKENRVPTAWLLAIGTPLPFFAALLATPLLPIGDFTGAAGSRAAVVLVFAAAAAVTSIPIITKIFHDLGILHTRFASLLLGAAVLEDIALWGVLSVATAIAAATVSSGGEELASAVTEHVAINTTFVVAALTVMPSVLRRLSHARWNVVAQEQPIAWMLAVLLGYVALAGWLDVTLVFAAFLAGFGVMGGMKSTEHVRFRAPIDSISQTAANFFIPISFAIVGYRLDFTQGFNPVMLASFLAGTSIVGMFAVGLGARMAGMNRRDMFNIAVTANARGGTGIVMAVAAYDGGIINGAFFTTLVLTAVLTSQACGFWLDRVLRSGSPLLSGQDLRRRGLEPLVDQELPHPTGAPVPHEPLAPAAQR